MTTCKLRLEGKVVIITGAASGIGEAAAKLFADHGATLVIADIQDKLGMQVAASIGDKCSYKHCDVSDEGQMKSLVDYAVGRHGRLDVMYSNAGVLGAAFVGLLDLEIEELHRVLAVNVAGSVAAVKHAARAMVAGGVRGSIVCTASVSAHRAGIGPASYVISKHALLGLVRAAAGEYGPHGIRVNCVSPFGVATPLACNGIGFGPEIVETNTSQQAHLKGVILKPGHVADAALFLASDESVFVSGHDLVIDGAATVYHRC